MELSKKERFFIANQLKILAALYPKEASFYNAQFEAIQQGYESEYSDILNLIEDETFNVQSSTEVTETLNMFAAIKRSYEAVEDKTGISAEAIHFSGYDGNDESNFLGYVGYVIEDKEKFRHILSDKKKHTDLNSHMPMREVYGRMLQKWNEIAHEEKHNLTKEQILVITNARIHPKNR